jgi:hypothetical protein
MTGFVEIPHFCEPAGISPAFLWRLSFGIEEKPAPGSLLGGNAARSNRENASTPPQVRFS